MAQKDSTKTQAASTENAGPVNLDLLEGEDMLKAQALFDAELEKLAETFETEQTGFAPYWVAGVGKMFYAQVLYLDQRDPEFPRYVCKALSPLVCQRGATDDATQLFVKKGELFTTSVWSGLELYKFFDLGVLVKCIKERKLAGNDASNGVKRKFYDWTTKVASKDKPVLDKRRDEDFKSLQMSRTRVAQLHAAGRVRSLDDETSKETADVL
jgi:hypothetical protein